MTKLCVVCPICRDTVECDFDGTLYGIMSIADLSLMELTAPAELSRHFESHKTRNESGIGFTWDERYYTRLREYGYSQMARGERIVTVIDQVHATK